MSAPQPDYQASIDFLQKVLPGGPWVLVAIDPDRKGIDAGTFGGNGVRDALPDFLKKQGTELKRNLYWSVNSTRRSMSKKPEKADIAALSWLHVDVDPSAPSEGTDAAAHNAAERDRILDRLRNLPDGIPTPTCVVFSGGGYQAFWRLKVPIPLDGTPEEWTEAERYNRKLEELLGGDHCHNCDRIMRLPGTINRPDAQKRAKGRSEARAEVVEFNDGLHDVSQFEKAAPKPSAAGLGGTLALEAGSDVTANLDKLPREVGRLCRVAIAQGCDPEDPWRWRKGDGPAYSDGFGLTCGAMWMGDRSAVVWYVVCALVRADVDDPTIRGFLLDPGWGISGHVLDQGDPERYADRQIEKAREAEGCPVPRPTIYTNLGEVAEVVDQATDALVRAGVRIYQRGTELVRLVKYGSVAPASDEADQPADGVRRRAESLVIYSASALWLVDQMSRAAKWRRKLQENDGPSDPSEKHGRLLLSRAGSWPFPPLRGIVTAPTLRADGSVLQVPGYDVASGLIFAPGGTSFPQVPEQPTRVDAIAALATFEPLFAEFPFVDEAARAVVLSAILSGLVRSSLQTIPLHAFDAPTAGTGKTMLAETVALIVMGHLPTLMNQGKEEGEDEKRIGAVLRAGDPCLLIDNCDRPIEGDTLCSVISQTQVDVRILGRSEKVTLPCDVLVMATGNNLQIVGDMARRTVVCRLDSEVERPERRRFDFDPRILAAEQRAELVVAGLTVLRAYIVAEGTERPSPVGSFEAWNRRVRAALLWCGAGDPVQTMERLVDENQGGSELGAILTTWWRVMGDSEPEVADLKDAGELANMLQEATSRAPWNARAVGWYLRRNVGKIVGGLVLRSIGDDGARVRRWQVVSTRGEEPGRGELAERGAADREVLG